MLSVCLPHRCYRVASLHPYQHGYHSGSLFLSAWLPLLCFFLSLCIAFLPAHPLPPPHTDPRTFHLFTPLSLPPASVSSLLYLRLISPLLIAANFCPLAFSTSFPSTPLRVSPSYLAFPQQQQMRFPFTEPPSLAPSLPCSTHSSFLPLRALFCLNQELKCCILTQTMPAIQSGPV